ncbi:MAG: MBL fold metallo-hydrolase [Saprospiraceae bacterium]|jgi:metallo-beta-lactamase family protein|nr:MBL fold metallo-hydrolase [Saprospiraceae bacterium]MDP4998715.1 MBL fold metallo-hydrolase [Saprospiraceae bacterium]
MKIKFCGAAQEVTGSAHLLELDNGTKILLDCGLFQGNSKKMAAFNEKWLFDPAEIDCVVLSHAHIDHSGRLPKLVKDGFRGSIFSTHATRSLCAIMLLDSAKIQERDAEYFNKKLEQKQDGKRGKHKHPKDPLYTTKDIEPTMECFATFGYNRWFSIHESVEVLFKDAGHILGSASVTLRIKENDRTIMLGFTGDIGRPQRPILRDPQIMPQVDYLICESTYGDQEHLEAPSEKEKFLQIIRNTCVENKGKLLIPAFSVGRTQEIVYILDQLEHEGKLPKIPVYVDSPLAVNATMIFGAHPECFDSDLNEYLLVDDDPFGFNSLTYVRDVELSKAINDSEEPAIIISSSGMMNAGRVKHHLYHMIDQPQHTILIVGYCTPDTPGGILRDGATFLRLFGQWKPVNANIVVMDSFSAHGDRLEMLDFIKHQKETASTVFLVHGTIDRQEPFKKMLLNYGFPSVNIPELGQEVHI